MKETIQPAEIDKKLAELREKARVMRFNFAGSQKNVKETKNIRREVARLETMKTANKKASIAAAQK